MDGQPEFLGHGGQEFQLEKRLGREGRSRESARQPSTHLVACVTCVHNTWGPRGTPLSAGG